MATQTIKKSVDIKAPKERVWEVLTEQPYLDDWTGSFMEGSKVKGVFKEGEQIQYSDGSGMGVVGEVSILKPYEELKISLQAELVDGKPDFDHPDSARWQGTYDHYQLSDHDGICTLTLETAFPAEFYDDFLPGWDKMIKRVKELAEK